MSDNNSSTTQPVRIRSRFPKAQPNIGPSSGINRIRRLSGHFNNNDEKQPQQSQTTTENDTKQEPVAASAVEIVVLPQQPVLIDEEKKEEILKLDETSLVSTATDSATLILIDDISTAKTSSTIQLNEETQEPPSIIVNNTNYNPRFSKEHIMNIIKFKALQKLKKIESDVRREFSFVTPDFLRVPSK